MSLGLGTSLSKSGLITPGTVTDSLVLKHNYAAGGVVPVSDGAAYLDATENYISFSSIVSDVDGGAASFHFWLKVISTGQEHLILTNGAYDHKFIRITSGGVIRFETDTNNNTAEATLSTWDVNWHSYAIVCSGAQTVIYQDGNALTMSTDDTLTNNVTFTRIGHPTGDSGVSLYGYICNVGIWSVALTQAQIKSIMWKNYAGLTSTETDNLVSWWNLDETVGDRSSHVEDLVDTSLGSELWDSPARTNGSIAKWTAYADNTVVTDDGAIKITLVGGAGAAAGAYIDLKDSNDLSSDLTVGKTYKFTCDAKVNTGGNGVVVRVHDTVAYHTMATVTSTSFVEITGYFTAVHATDCKVNMEMDSTDIIWLDNFSLKEVQGNIGELK